MDLSLFLSIGSVVLVLITFILNRLDKKEKDVKDAKEEYKKENKALIEYQLKELKEDVKTILSKMDVFDKETDKKIENAIDLHVKLYHKGEK